MIRHEIITITNNILLMFIDIINIIGAIFCHVNNNKELIQLSPSITSGNQKCIGAAPSFVKSAEFITILNEKFTRGLINSSDTSNIIIAINKISEAIACVIKYFIADSDANIFFFSEKSGMIESKLISSPIHTLIQE